MFDIFPGKCQINWDIYNEAVNDLVKVSTTLGFILNNLSHKSHIHHLSLVYRWSFPSYTLKVIIDPYPIFRATLTYILLWTHPNESLHLFLVVKQFCYIRSSSTDPSWFYEHISTYIVNNVIRLKGLLMTGVLRIMINQMVR